MVVSKVRCDDGGPMCGGTLNFDLIRETLFLISPHYPMGLTLRLGLPTDRCP